MSTRLQTLLTLLTLTTTTACTTTSPAPDSDPFADVQPTPERVELTDSTELLTGLYHRIDGDHDQTCRVTPDGTLLCRGDSPPTSGTFTLWGLPVVGPDHAAAPDGRATPATRPPETRPIIVADASANNQALRTIIYTSERNSAPPVSFNPQHADEDLFYTSPSMAVPLSRTRFTLDCQPTPPPSSSKNTAPKRWRCHPQPAPDDTDEETVTFIPVGTYRRSTAPPEKERGGFLDVRAIKESSYVPARTSVPAATRHSRPTPISRATKRRS